MSIHYCVCKYSQFKVQYPAQGWFLFNFYFYKHFKCKLLDNIQTGHQILKHSNISQLNNQCFHLFSFLLVMLWPSQLIDHSQPGWRPILDRSLVVPRSLKFPNQSLVTQCRCSEGGDNTDFRWRRWGQDADTKQTRNTDKPEKTKLMAKKHKCKVKKPQQNAGSQTRDHDTMKVPLIAFRQTAVSAVLRVTKCWGAASFNSVLLDYICCQFAYFPSSSYVYNINIPIDLSNANYSVLYCWTRNHGWCSTENSNEPIANLYL